MTPKARTRTTRPAITTTTREYITLDQAYTFFNRRLFEGKLPECLIVLHRHAKAYGYFHAQRFVSRENRGKHADEIALNPDGFIGRDDLEILSTLAHEMAHVWQFHNGEPSRGGYHNKEWAGKMDDIGLTPSSTGGPGGKRTGQHVSHYIVENGPFHVLCNQFLASGKKLRWSSFPIDAEGGKPKPKSKVKFTCPGCSQNAWAKPTASLICGECEVPMIGEDA